MTRDTKEDRIFSRSGNVWRVPYRENAPRCSDLLDILDVFGEDGLRSYLAGVLEGEEQAVEVEEDLLDEGEEDGD
jgi:hypothetical protein